VLSSKCLTTADPMKPALPVTKIVDPLKIIPEKSRCLRHY